MIVLALAAFAVSASATEAASGAKPIKVAVFCTKSSQQSSGLTKICYYDCAGREGAVKVKVYDACPRWTPRWRLNRSGPFGPSKKD